MSRFRVIDGGRSDRPIPASEVPPHDQMPLADRRFDDIFPVALTIRQIVVLQAVAENEARNTRHAGDNGYWSDICETAAMRLQGALFQHTDAQHDDDGGAA
jgi:hypothetical protein